MSESNEEEILSVIRERVYIEVTETYEYTGAKYLSFDLKIRNSSGPDETVSSDLIEIEEAKEHY